MNVVLWVSRHSPLPEQLNKLTQYLRNYKLVMIRERIPNAEWLYNNYIKPLLDQNHRVIVIPVLPLSIIARLVELAKQYHFEIWYAKMNEIYRTNDISKAELVLSEAPERRTIMQYADGIVKVYEFEDFYRVKEIKIELEKIS